ncbi:MAG: tRNA 4-thiouridine(8) synthase ThiI [Candidatus Omnitrophota bacterium]
MTKALGLLSGGLDSMLAVKILQEQGIDVTAISFATPFFGSKNAEKAARDLKIPIIIKDITGKHLEMLLKPKHGYGSGMNPCIDCHALMLEIAGRIMEEKGFDFIFTGEVLGERPMSQNKQSLHIVAKESGYADYVLRPLSAKLLPETKPEKEGKVDREKLLDFSGRQRKRQFEMAKSYNIKDFPTPASGCCLTDPGFAGRLKDLIRREGKPDIADIRLLKTGRHIALDERHKIIIGRNKEDNATLAAIKNGKFALFAPRGVPGPYCMVPQELAGELLDKAAKICASYCSGREGERVIFREKGAKPGREINAIYSKSNRPKEFVGCRR